MIPLFYVSRHGRTEGNEDNRYRGHSNEPFALLSPDGRDDAREAALYLKKIEVKPPLILADDLSRSQETQKIMAGILGVRELETDKRLRPLDVGEFTGKDKFEHPLDEYITNRNKKIPGGESMKLFDRRLAEVCADVMELIARLKKPIVVVGHGSTISFLHNNFRGGTFHAEEQGPRVGYEGLVHPGGVLMFARQGITPLLKSKQFDGEKMPYKDGTPLAGFVTDEQNEPPRECWNCRNFGKEISGLGYCNHPLVRLDPKLQDRKQADGTVAVGERDCCDFFRNKIATR